MKDQKKNELKKQQIWKSPAINTMTPVELKKSIRVSACSEFYGECHHSFWR